MASVENDEPPFELQSIIGFNLEVPIVNLTRKSSEVTVAAAVSHVMITYNHSTGVVHHMMGGHNGKIHELHCDQTGRFVVSVSIESCVIWERGASDKIASIAIRYIEDPFGKGGHIDKSAISADAKYLILTGGLATTKRLQLWTWSAGRDAPEYDCELPGNIGDVRQLTFDRFCEPTISVFAVTMTKNVLFGTWSEDSQTVNLQTPKIASKLSFKMTSFTSKMTAISITEQGLGTIWSHDFGNRIYHLEKSVRLSTTALFNVDFVDEMVVILEGNGDFRFYDHMLKILFNIDDDEDKVALNGIVFDLCPREYRIEDAHHFDTWSKGTPELEVLFLENVPKCITSAEEPFLTRSFVAITKDGSLCRWDLVNRRMENMSIFAFPSVINTFDVDLRRGRICGGCVDGRLFIYDYVNRKTIKSMMGTDQTEHRLPTINLVIYTDDGRYIVVAVKNTVYLVDSILLKPFGKPVKIAEGDITHICASESGETMAYCDSDRTTVLLSINNSRGFFELMPIGKHRSHRDVITSILFVGTGTHERLITFGMDHYMVEYDVHKSVLEGGMHMVQRKRFNQTSKPIGAVLLDGSFGQYKDSPCVLVCDNQFKCRVLCANTLDQTMTALGPLFDVTPMHLMCPLDVGDDPNQRYLAYATKGTMLGLQMMPFDGNAYRSIAMLGNAKEFKKLVALKGTDLLMTLGDGESSVWIWSVRPNIVQQNFDRGGPQLMPFCKALPGGRDGWLFREMQDLFYYMQILTKSLDSPEEQQVSDYITMSETPDYLRALGYFPSEEETLNILAELTDQRPHTARYSKVSFGQLLRIYVNHKPVHGYLMEDLRRSMGYFAGVPSTGSRFSMGNAMRKSYAKNTDLWLLDRDQLMDICCSHGEQMERVEVARCLRKLLNPMEEVNDERHGGGTSEEEILLNLLYDQPEVFNITDFLANIFGLHMNDSNGDSLVYDGTNDPSTLNERLQNDLCENRQPTKPDEYWGD